jgi:hypothetical protein
VVIYECIFIKTYVTFIIAYIIAYVTHLLIGNFLFRNTFKMSHSVTAVNAAMYLRHVRCQQFKFLFRVFLSISTSTFLCTRSPTSNTDKQQSVFPSLSFV